MAKPTRQLYRLMCGPRAKNGFAFPSAGKEVKWHQLVIHENSMTSTRPGTACGGCELPRGSWAVDRDHVDTGAENIYFLILSRSSLSPVLGQTCVWATQYIYIYIYFFKGPFPGEGHQT